MKVAALFVDPNGVYADIPDVDVWDEARDARLYAGPWPVVAHPPCARWGSLAYVNQSMHGYRVGDDGGCFEAALAAVRTWGGVLLHWIEDGSYDLVILDPPYSNEESELLYGTPPLRWTTFVREAVRVCKVGGHVAVYHVKQPPRPSGTRLVRRIVILTRTWHAPRVCFVFEKLPPDEETRLFT